MNLKNTIGKVLEIFTLSFVITLLFGLLILGMIAGYLKGREDAQKELLSYFEREISAVSSATPTITLKPSQSTPVKKQIYTKNVWSGPDLWLAVNKKRVEYGVNPLDERDELCTIASIRLNELLRLGTLDGHKGFGDMQSDRPDLKWIFEKYPVIAEFLAFGGDSPQETVGLWENTLGHKKLLTAGEYVWGCVYAQNTFAVAIAAY